MTIKIYNTLSREKEDFKPIHDNNVRIYVCGPTVYDYAHIGNFRPVVVFDLLFRLLRDTYGEDYVTYARNITDIDDKIIKAAGEQGVDISVITKKFTDIYNEDSAKLNALPPTLEPKATETLPEMITMIETLIAGGFAYVAKRHVLFHVPSMKNYGRLSKKPRDDLIAGARVEVAPYKKDPADFVMWKPSTDDQPGWDSPWGRGRPGWHLECSCMIEKHLGETIDIHGGGLDLIFPHHENELAQSECAHGKPFANYWMHNGYLVMGDEKMSKSLGNVQTMHALLGKHKGEALRLTLLSAHYRQPLDFSEEVVREQKRRLDRWYRLTEGIEPGEVPASVLDALRDDLNTPKALSELSALAKEENFSELLAGAQFLGLLMETTEKWFQETLEKDSAHPVTAVQTISEDQINLLIKERELARKNDDFERSDQIRDKLKSEGILLEDNPDGGTTWRRAD